jgi:hypothetical protein
VRYLCTPSWGAVLSGWLDERPNESAPRAANRCSSTSVPTVGVKGAHVMITGIAARGSLDEEIAHPRSVDPSGSVPALQTAPRNFRSGRDSSSDRRG